MRIALGADHGGYALKQILGEWLRGQGHEVLDAGTSSEESTDYPDYAEIVGRQVVSGAADRGVLVCTTGVGMSIAANKVTGVRAALAVNDDEVRLTRAHNDANVLTIGSRYTNQSTAEQLIGVFLDTAFEGGRHARRIGKISRIEAGRA